MLIDCHLHTSRYSPCSGLEPATACSLALQRGLDALVITEHQMQWTAAELDELQGEFPGLRIYSGLEVSLAEGCDIVIITATRGLTFPYGVSLDMVLRELFSRHEESFLFLAHAFRWTEERSAQMERVLDSVDGLEMNSVNILRPYPDRLDGLYRPKLQRLYESVQLEHKLVPLYNSDAHSPQAVGSLASAIDGSVPPQSETELAALLKLSHPREHQTPRLLRRLMA